MTVSERLATGFLSTINTIGIPVRIQYFEGTNGSVYDEPDTPTQSGTDLWISGAVFPIKSTEGSEDAVLLEQGKLQDKDKKLYVNGSIDFAGVYQTCKVQLGSPTGEIYSTIPLGGKAPEVSGDKIYKKQYIRYLGTTGSF